MKRKNYMVAGLLGVLLAFSLDGCASGGVKASLVKEESVSDVIAKAEQAVNEARQAIKVGREQSENLQLPEDSPYNADVVAAIHAGGENWKLALAALENAKKCEALLASSSDGAADLEALARVNAHLAVSHANAVKVSLSFVNALALGKTESLGVLKGAMADASAVSLQLQKNHDELEKVISKKYAE